MPWTLNSSYGCQVHYIVIVYRLTSDVIDWYTISILYQLRVALSYHQHYHSAKTMLIFSCMSITALLLYFGELLLLKLMKEQNKVISIALCII